MYECQVAWGILDFVFLYFCCHHLLFPRFLRSALPSLWFSFSFPFTSVFPKNCVSFLLRFSLLSCKTHRFLRFTFHSPCRTPLCCDQAPTKTNTNLMSSFWKTFSCAAIDDGKPSVLLQFPFRGCTRKSILQWWLAYPP